MVKILSLLILSLSILIPLFKPGFYKSDDGEWMIIRLSAFHSTLASGQFPVRFVERLNNNYGYPVSNFLYPLPFYLAEIPYMIFQNFTLSIKVVFIASTIFSTIFMYWALALRFSSAASLIGAVVYLLFPYRLINLYSRGSLGEVVALSILPIILGSIIKISEGKNAYHPILAICVFSLITAHNVIAALFVPITLLFVYIFAKNEYKITLFSVAQGVALASFFWIPALLDLKYVRLSQIDISKPSEYLASIFMILSPWSNELSPTRAYAFTGILPIFLIAYVIYLKRHKKLNLMVKASIIIIIFNVILMSEFSRIIWNYLPFISVIQFPWRLTSIVMFFSSLLATYIVHETKGVAVKFTIIALLIISALPFLTPKQYVHREDSYYYTNEDTTTVKDEYLPLWVGEKPAGRALSKFQPDETLTITDEIIKGSTYSANVSTNSNTNLTINTIYFPGHQAFVDDKQVTIKPSARHGLITVELPEGIHKVIIKYGKTRVHLLSELLSIAALATVAISILYLWRKQNF